MPQPPQAANQSGEQLNEVVKEQLPNRQNPPVPHVGKPLDGSQYLDVLEEQLHANQAPQPEGQNPLHPEIDPSVPKERGA